MKNVTINSIIYMAGVEILKDNLQNMKSQNNYHLHYRRYILNKEERELKKFDKILKKQLNKELKLSYKLTELMYPQK